MRMIMKNFSVEQIWIEVEQNCRAPVFETQKPMLLQYNRWTSQWKERKEKVGNRLNTD